MRKDLAGVILVGIFAVSALGQTAAQGPAVSGVWISNSDAAVKLTVTEQDNKVHVQEMNGNKLVVDYTCPVSGQECEVKEDGHPEKVMLYFNRSRLVEPKERGGELAKRRFEPSTDGQTMHVEILPLSSSEKTETMTFKREAPASSKTSS